MEVSKFAEEELRRTEAIKRDKTLQDDPDKGYADSAAAAQAVAMAMPGNGVYHFDRDTANDERGLNKADIEKQGEEKNDYFPLNTYIFNDFALFLYIYKRKEKEDGEGSGSG